MNQKTIEQLKEDSRNFISKSIPGNTSEITEDELGMITDFWINKLTTILKDKEERVKKIKPTNSDTKFYNNGMLDTIDDVLSIIKD